MGYEVRLTKPGSQKVKDIKKVCGLTGWGLEEAKNFVNAAPDAIFKVGSKDEAMRVETK